MDGLCPQLRNLLPDVRLAPLLVGAERDPIELVGEAVAGQLVDTLHVVAHGRRGGFQLGEQWIDRKVLVENAASLARWTFRRIALWSCSLGQDPSFISLLAELTGAEVWSTDQSLGEGQIWRLKLSAPEHAASPGCVLSDEPQPPFTMAALKSWPYQLNRKCPDPFRETLGNPGDSGENGCDRRSGLG